MKPILLTPALSNTIEGFDKQYPVCWTVSAVNGNKVSVFAHIENDWAVVSIVLQTPSGILEKNFTFHQNVRFTWKPTRFVKIETSISSFTIEASHVRFNISFVVVDGPLARSPLFNHTFQLTRCFCSALENTEIDSVRTEQMLQKISLSDLMLPESNLVPVHI